MDKYTKFNADFFKDDKTITWFGKKGVKVLDETKNAEITLVTTGTQGVYTGYNVSVVSKEFGQITSHHFGFDQYLSTRVDTRKDLPNQRFEIIDHCFDQRKGDAWYIAIPAPAEVAKMAQQVDNFLALYMSGPVAKKTKTKSV